MAPASRRSSGQATSAELSLVHLKQCLVNLPSSLESALVSVNTPAQNVIVELSYKLPPSASSPKGENGAPIQKSIYVGWTGMPSKRKLAPIVSRDGISGSRGNPSGREQDIQLVEIDATFARMLGLSDGLKVTASLHVDPPLAHTVNIEPLTPADWEIIELHATFLELNMLSQIRALPNPNYISPGGNLTEAHPLTLHLSPTSTANIRVTSLSPPPPASSPFAKVAPDAEIIVAPKTRAKPTRTNTRENRSVTSKRSTGARSGSGAVRQKAQEDAKLTLFLRGLDKDTCDEFFDLPDQQTNQEMTVWVDRDLLASKDLLGVKWVSVTVIKPASLEAPVEPQRQQQEAEADAQSGKPTSRVIARLLPWDDPPDSRHTALSSALCASLACTGIVGGVVKIEPAPPPASGNAVQKLKIFPFSTTHDRSSDGLKFGGESKTEREEAAKRIEHMYGKQSFGKGLLEGPITDGMVLSSNPDPTNYPNWTGGILRLEVRQDSHLPSVPNEPIWIIGSDSKAPIEVQVARSCPMSYGGSSRSTALRESSASPLVGIESLMGQLRSHLSHLSSVLLTGGLGAGKTSAAKSMSETLRNDMLFHTTYFSCRQLVTDETRVSTIKETLTRLFMDAAWGARFGGQSIVVLDDLDKLCPAETELQVGGENGRSRQISESICSIVKQYCTRDSRVVLLATAQAKESIHNVIVGGHVVREILTLKAPNKEGRRRIMETVVHMNVAKAKDVEEIDPPSRPKTADSSGREDSGGAWMDGASDHGRPKSPRNADGFIVHRDVDFLDLAGQTDGYMPEDLVLLVARARNVALIRSVSEDLSASNESAVQLTRKDFERALKGFTPASLRNVTLQTSTTTFDSIGGLHETRKVLLETLQYPTTYAPIFAQCPLRLRSGLLLYGYPGCGKTMLASAVAGECGLNFISVKGPEILNKYIGASEKSVRDLFDRAEAARPCVLFFDEFDSIAPKRGHDSTGVTDRVVNQLLTQMDGAEGLSGVYVLAATSRPDLIDPALLRPGRLDKSLICDLPDLEDRVDILRALGKKLKLSEEVQKGPEGGLQEIAERTEGYSGADLQALVYNAHLEAIHDLLGDDDNSKRPGAKTNGTSSTAALRNEFIQFRYSAEEQAREAEAQAKAGHNRSKAIAERAAIATKLDAIKAAKKRAKLSKIPSVGVDSSHGKANVPYWDEVGENGKAMEGKEQQEPTILWKHMMKSLESTRASISPDERKRLNAIYREFVVGRNGEMPDGQGPTEVGGRSSLM